MNLKFYFALGGLKTLHRTGWVRREIPHAETVDQHMYRAQYIAYDIAKELGGDLTFCMSCAFMMTIHDMPEMPVLGVGDITPRCGVSKEDKAALELQAATAASVMSGHPEFLEIFKEFEAGETLRSRICTDADALEALVQVIEYERLYPEKSFDTFWPYSEAKITTEPGKRIFAELDGLRLKNQAPAQVSTPPKLSL